MPQQRRIKTICNEICGPAMSFVQPRVQTRARAHARTPTHAQTATRTRAHTHAHMCTHSLASRKRTHKQSCTYTHLHHFSRAQFCELLTRHPTVASRDSSADIVARENFVCVCVCVHACVRVCVRACALLIARMAWPARISRCKSFLRVAAAALDALEGEADEANEADERCLCTKVTFA